MAGTNVVIVDHDAFLRHGVEGHPERPERLISIRERLQSDRWNDLSWITPEPATREQVTAVHASSLFESVQRMSEQGGGWFDADTYCTEASMEAALFAAGAAISAVDVALAGTRHSFALTRPPGHHATSDTAMGFCLFNNVAIAVRHAQVKHGLERVAIIDIDVHHGNGTEEIFTGDATVLYCSLHQWPFYPGTGSPTETNNIVDVCLPAGADGTEWLAAFDREVVPAVRDFAPQLILVSAGYDGHEADPLAELRLTTEDYGTIAQRIVALASQAGAAKTAWMLEGGYNLEALASSVENTIAVLDRE